MVLWSPKSHVREKNLELYGPDICWVRMNPFAVTNCFEISVLMCVSLLLNNCRPFHFQNIVLYLASQCHKHLTAVIHNSSQNSVVIMNAAFSVHMSLNNRFLFQYKTACCCKNSNSVCYFLLCLTQATFRGYGPGHFSCRYKSVHRTSLHLKWSTQDSDLTNMCHWIRDKWGRLGIGNWWREIGYDISTFSSTPPVGCSVLIVQRAEK